MVQYKNRRHRLEMEYGIGVARAYSTWTEMRRRVRDPDPKRSNGCYVNVSIDPRWNIFENFLMDMGEPQEGQSIDRIENLKGYEPDNCRWTDSVTQSRNRTYCRITEEKAAEIRALYAKGNVSQTKLANKYGVTQPMIGNIVRNESWI